MPSFGLAWFCPLPDLAALDIDALSEAYAGAPAVDRLSFRVASGGCIALLGPSGCGKTTLRMVAGFVKPDNGHIRLAGRWSTSRRTGAASAWSSRPTPCSRTMTAAGNVAFVTHDQEEAMALGDRVAVLRAGRLMECAAPPACSPLASWAPAPCWPDGWRRARS